MSLSSQVLTILIHLVGFGILWKDITEQEMYQFFGALLRSSLQPVDSGGYAAYFRSTNLQVEVHNGHTIEVPGTSGFMSHLPEKYRMTMNRFKQLSGAYHPEDQELGNSTEDSDSESRSILRGYSWLLTD
jgi:hypothetical protein